MSEFDKPERLAYLIEQAAEQARLDERERIAQEIETKVNKADRPRLPNAEFATDLANDAQWAAMIARGQV